MRLSTRRLLSLFLVAILVAGQWAGQLHALSHAEHDLAVAHFSAEAAGADGHHEPLLDHAADHCVAFHALDNAAATASISGFSSSTAGPGLPPLQRVLLPAEPVPFSSRAPPRLLT